MAIVVTDRDGVPIFKGKSEHRLQSKSSNGHEEETMWEKEQMLVCSIFLYSHVQCFLNHGDFLSFKSNLIFCLQRLPIHHMSSTLVSISEYC